MDEEVLLLNANQEVSNNDDGILYDVSYHVEFAEEKEVVRSSPTEEQSSGLLYGAAKSLKSSVSRWTWSTIRAVGIPVRTGAPCLLPPDLIKLISSRHSWTMSRSPDGNFLAILQDGCLEIRTSKDEYNAVIGRCVFSKDPNPQWRAVSWNRESKAVAFSESDGTVHLCDIKGVVLMSFQGHLTEDKDYFDYSAAVCALCFLNTDPFKCDAKSSLLVIVSFSGAATFLEINDSFVGRSKVLFNFDFSQTLSKGVCAVSYDDTHEILIVGGCTGYNRDDVHVPKATKYGITAWRIVTDEPYLKSIDVFIDSGDGRGKLNLLRRLSTVPADLGKKWRGGDIDGVFTMTVSPCHRFLVAIHLSGDLSIWEIPSLRQKHVWKSETQPFYGEIPCEDSGGLASSKKSKKSAHFQNLIDCEWWDDSSVIVVRCSGSLAVVSVLGDRLESLFGDSCEWLEPSPEISFCRDEGFLALECETKVKSLKRQREPSNDESSIADELPSLEDSDDDAGFGAVQHLKNNAKSAIYQWTDIDYFKPPRKRPKLVMKSYRLLSVTKTTPEKLFEKRLEDEEYGEALALARKYNLDGDKVFQRQWKKSNVSVASIQDYLSKISKRSWVMHECCDRVPDDLDAAKELLKFALTITDVDQLAKISIKDTDSDDSTDSDFEEYQGFDVEEQKNQQIRQRRKFVDKWLKFVDFSDLSLDQKEMIRARRRIIKYSDRLSTYENLLGGYDAARERYNKDKFADFRQKDMFVAALEHARNGNWKALDILFTYHGDDLREHRLALLCNIPKTISPSEYRCLLPQIGENGSVEQLVEMKHRDVEDWCEQDKYSAMLTSLTNPTNPTLEFYEEYPSLSQFKTKHPTDRLVSEWYLQQARDFDADALDIDGALKLLEIGAAYGVPGLDSLTNDLKTLETLVYECKYDTVLTLKDLQKESKLQRLKMLMETSSREMYVKNFHRWALPFLKTCNKDDQPMIFRDYVMELAENDLTLPSLIFASFLRDRSMPEAVSSLENLAKLAFECIYANSNPDQLEIVKNVQLSLSGLEKTILKSVGIDEVAKLDDRVFACSLLAGDGVRVTPDHIREIESDRTKVEKLLVRFSRTVGAREPGLNKSEWNAFLKSMLRLRDKIFSKTCGLETAVCISVFVESLLTSGDAKNFQIAGEHMMRTSDEERQTARHRLYGSSQQKLSYESSVALVIKSSQEYFDASTPTSNDNMLGLARECLLLISDRPESVRERLDLIEGVVLLQKFGVDKLPLQVRLTEDRIALIRMALDVDKDAYKKTEVLLRLAMLLHVSGDNKTDRKGKVLIMIAERALEIGDFEYGYCLCQELVCMPFPSAWRVCLELAKTDDFENLVGRRDVLSFVACHCDKANLPEVLELLCDLKCAILRTLIAPAKKSEENLVTDNAEVSDSDRTEVASTNELVSGRDALDKLVHKSADFLSPVNMLKSTAKGTKAMLNATGNVLSATGTVLSATSNTTKAVLSNVKNVEWWRSTIDKTLSSIPIPDLDMQVGDDTEMGTPNSDLTFHGCPEFYSGIIDGSVSKCGLMISDETFYSPKNLSHNQTLLRIKQLSSDGDDSALNESWVLENLVIESLPYDFALALSYALSIADVTKAYNCLEKLPVSALSLQLSLYYFALRLAEAIGMNSDNCSKVYDLPPVDLIKRALVWISSNNLDQGSCEHKLATYMNEVQEQMFEFAQAEKLQDLDKGIDLSRFTSDSEYREETILGLAMTTDDEQYKIAVSSAHRSGTDLWLVLMTHLEFLFTECQDLLTSDKLQQRVEHLNMMPELSKRKVEFYKKMDTCIFPFIDGKDHDRLLLFFSLLNACNDNGTYVPENGLCKLSPANHSKLLKKLKAMTPNLDYKALFADGTAASLTDTKSRVMDILLLFLDTTNVQMFAKMMPQIPYSNCKISSSSVYLETCKKIMGEDKQAAPENSEELLQVNWTHRYESCAAYLRMCCPADLLSFFEFVLFNSKASTNIPLGSRQDILKRGVKLCKIQVTKEKKNQLDESISGGGENFATVLPSFVRMSKHLDSFSTSFVSNLMKSSEHDDRMRKYLYLYDESQSKSEPILDLAALMLEDGTSPEFIQSLFAVVSGNKWKCRDALRKSIDNIVNRGSGSVVDKLTVLAKSVGDHEREGGKILNSADVIGLLRPFCSDTSIESKLRVDVLKLLEDQFQLDDSEARLLLLHRTEAIVKDSWSEECWKQLLQTIGDAEISQEQTRNDAFEKLLDFGELNARRCKSLVDLLEIWPEFETETRKNQCWQSVLIAMAESGTEGQKELIKVSRNRLSTFPKSLTTDVFRKLVEAKAAFFAIKFGLLADLPELQDEIVTAIKSVQTMGPSQCDEEILDLMLEKSIAVHTIGTLYYAKISEYLVSSESPDTERYVHQLARQLQDLGHLPEAGTLLLNYRGTHPAFRTFNNALSSLKRWLNS